MAESATTQHPSAPKGKGKAAGKGEGKGKGSGRAPARLSRMEAQAARTPYSSQPRPVASTSTAAESTSAMDAVAPIWPSRPTSDSALVDLGPVVRSAAVAALPRPAEAWGKLLRRILSSASPEVRPRLLVLPEGGIQEFGPCDESHPIVRELTPVAAEFDVVIAAGTMVVLDDSIANGYCNVCPVISSAGLLGSYSKRQQGSFTDQSQGPPLEVFDTPIGKLGVLICLDVEDDNLLREMSRRCSIIANPAHIPYQQMGSWAIAQDSMRRRLEWWTGATGVSIVRCDLPPPGGMGCSMVVTPCETFLGSCAKDELLLAPVPTNAARRGAHAWLATRGRQELLDNCGTRLLVSKAAPVKGKSIPAGAAIASAVAAAAAQATESKEVDASAQGAAEKEVSPQTLALSMEDLQCRAVADSITWCWDVDGASDDLSTGTSDGANGSASGEKPGPLVVHRCPFPEPVADLERSSNNKVLVRGVHGGLWTVVLTQNRLPCSFEAAWGRQRESASAGATR